MKVPIYNNFIPIELGYIFFFWFWKIKYFFGDFRAVAN